MTYFAGAYTSATSKRLSSSDPGLCDGDNQQLKAVKSFLKAQEAKLPVERAVNELLYELHTKGPEHFDYSRLVRKCVGRAGGAASACARLASYVGLVSEP